MARKKKKDKKKGKDEDDGFPDSVVDTEEVTPEVGEGEPSLESPVEAPGEDASGSTGENVVATPSFAQGDGSTGPKINPLTMKPAATAAAASQTPESEIPAGMTPEGVPLEGQPIQSEPIPQVEEPPAPDVFALGAPIEFTGESMGSLEGDLAMFFQELSVSFSDRYELWEGSINTILTLLRKLQQVTNTNAEIMISSIEKMHDEIKVGLNHFVTIRSETEKYADQDLNEVTKNLKRVLGILSLQIKEYQLKHKVDSYLKTVTPKH